MTAEERIKCRKVQGLFAEYLEERGEICIAETEQYGFVILYDMVHDCFEHNIVCRSAEELYEQLLALWEVDYLFMAGLENGCEDFEASEESLTAEQRQYREEKREYYRKGMENI